VSKSAKVVLVHRQCEQDRHNLINLPQLLTSSWLIVGLSELLILALSRIGAAG
jgi:hypothetical protein